MKLVGDLLLLARTVRNLAPSQVAHRVRLRCQQASIRLAPEIAAKLLTRQYHDEPSWPPGFRPFQAEVPIDYPSVEANGKGTFEFLSQRRDLGSPPDWKPSSVDRLWSFHLHYFDWAWSFCRHPDNAWARASFHELWQSWRSSILLGDRDAWSPYVASCRLWNLCGIHKDLISGEGHETNFIDDLGLHTGFVKANLEKDVGGNHLLKNLKALIGAGVFFGDTSLVNAGTELLAKTLRTQVLDDGGHFELSPSYHCQVLADLIDLQGLLQASPWGTSGFLNPIIDKMRSWLGSMLMPDGSMPLLNDAWEVNSQALSWLDPVPDSQPFTVLEESGYVVVRPCPGTQATLDVGPPGPPRLPAHSQADALSFVLSVDGLPVVVDTGVSTYEPGCRRSFERSTAAHSTVGIDGEDQSEVWGSFRVARRASTTLHEVRDDNGTVVVIASQDGYRRLPGSPIHKRTWRVSADSVLIEDRVEGAGTRVITRRLILANGLNPKRTPDGYVLGKALLRSDESNFNWEKVPVETADGRGGLQLAWALVSTVSRELPAVLTTTLVLC